MEMDDTGVTFGAVADVGVCKTDKIPLFVGVAAVFVDVLQLPV